jgi:hypothetical protein
MLLQRRFLDEVLLILKAISFGFYPLLLLPCLKLCGYARHTSPNLMVLQISLSLSHCATCYKVTPLNSMLTSEVLLYEALSLVSNGD